MMTDAEHAAFLRGFDLAQPPGREELDAIKHVREFGPDECEMTRVAISKSTGKKFLAIVDSLPDQLTRAVWVGFIRGLVAQAGGEVAYVHDRCTA